MNPQLFEIVCEKLGVALREVQASVAIGADTPIFGRESPLDSTQLVSLIVDVEEGVFERLGVEVTLADRRAMSQKQSPFRTVQSLCAYLETLIAESADEA